MNTRVVDRIGSQLGVKSFDSCVYECLHPGVTPNKTSPASKMILETFTPTY